MGALYDQMKMDLELKNFSPKTVTCYLTCMVNFVRHYGQSPVEMGEEEIRKYLHYLIHEKKASQSIIKQAYSAMKFFYETTLGKVWNATRIPRSKLRKKLPVVLSTQEVQSLLASVDNRFLQGKKRLRLVDQYEKLFKSFLIQLRDGPRGHYRQALLAKGVEGKRDRPGCDRNDRPLPEHAQAHLPGCFFHQCSSVFKNRPMMRTLTMGLSG